MVTDVDYRPFMKCKQIYLLIVVLNLVLPVSLTGINSKINTKFNATIAIGKFVYIS